jgi:hypothetical protein
VRLTTLKTNKPVKNPSIPTPCPFPVPPFKLVLTANGPGKSHLITTADPIAPTVCAGITNNILHRVIFLVRKSETVTQGLNCPPERE